ASPDYPNHLSDVPCPLPRRIERVRVSIASPLMQPSPNGRRVGIRIVTFEACSGFTHVTARRIAQPPKAAFVTRLQPCRLPGRAARQLPDQSTTLWVESSSTRAFTEKTESWDSPAGTNRIQGLCWSGGQHGWRNRIRRICVGALLVRGKMALPSRKLRSNLE